MDTMELIRLLRRAARRSGHPGGMDPMGEPPEAGEERRCPPGPHGMPGEGGPGPHGPFGPGGPHRERERVLSLLDETEGISQQKLALILGIRPQSLSELLGKLERDALLTRTKNPEDRRETLVSLTPEGRERAAAYEAERSRAGESFLAPLTEEERESLAALLRKLLGPEEIF